MSASSTNLHFHGLNIPPVCHQDEVIRTLVQPGDPPFEYRFKIPKGQPPGLYWYHPHPHGYSEKQVLGGASGALIVEGIEKVKPQVAGLPERVLVLRDQKIPLKGPGAAYADDLADGPAKDISINFVPVLFPLLRPAVIDVKPLQREFWRVLNGAADTYFDLQIRSGQTIQEIRTPVPVELVALDGVPIAAIGPAARRDHVLLAPGARAEFIVATPPLGTFAQLVTLRYDTGPDGEHEPYRVIANIQSRRDAEAPPTLPGAPSPVHPDYAAGLAILAPAVERKLYFSEDRQDLKDPSKRAKYFITVEGATPKVFDMNSPSPDITVRQGTVEDWVIENRAREAHAFHIHQLHFLVLERDGQKVNEPLLLDTIDLPYWDEKSPKSPKYPSVKLRMDFRSPEIAGDFLYHCHLLEHEDGGMMGSIRVLPRRASQ